MGRMTPDRKQGTIDQITDARAYRCVDRFNLVLEVRFDALDQVLEKYFSSRQGKVLEPDRAQFVRSYSRKLVAQGAAVVFVDPLISPQQRSLLSEYAGLVYAEKAIDVSDEAGKLPEGLEKTSAGRTLTQNAAKLAQIAEQSIPLWPRKQ